MSIEDMWVLPRPYVGSPIHHLPQGRVSAGRPGAGQWTEKVNTESEIELFDDDMESEKDYGESYDPDIDVDEKPSLEAFQESLLGDLERNKSRSGYLAARRSHRAWRGSLLAAGKSEEVAEIEYLALESIRSAERSKLGAFNGIVSKLTISFVTKKRNRTITVPAAGFRTYKRDHPDNEGVVNAAYISAHVQLGLRHDPMEYYALHEAIRSALAQRAGIYELKERRGRNLRTDYDLMEIKIIPG